MNIPRKLNVALGACALAVLALIGSLIWSGYRDAIVTAETTTRNYAAIIEARLDATLRRIDADLQELRRTLPLAALSERAVPRYAREINAQLDARLGNFSELANIRIFNAGGENLYSTNRKSLPRTNIGDRDYFHRLRDDPQRGLVFSEVVIARAMGRPTLLAARALQDGQGIFRGVVVAAIELDYFQKLFQSVELGHQGYLAIHRSDDFSVVVRRPQVDSLLNVRLPLGHPTREVLARGNKTATEMRKFSSDGIERISSVRVLDQYPFFVTAAIASGDVLAGWKVRALVVGLSLLLLLLLLGAMLYRVSRAERQQAKLAAIVESSNDAVVGRSLDGEIESWNPAAVRLFGWTVAEAIGRGVTLAPPERKAEVAQNILGIKQGRWVVDGDTERLTKDGRRIPVSLSQSPIKDASGAVIGAAAIYRDISERKRNEALLQSAKAEAEAANNAKSRFLAAASHDLRQPLAAATLYAGMLSNMAAAGDAQLVARVKECLNTLSKLLEDIFDLSKLDAGVVVAKPADFSIDELFGAIKAIYSGEAAAKGLQLRFRRYGALVLTDSHRLHRILGNLVANAIKFTDRGGVLVACRRHANKLWVEVWDTGIGIADDKSGFIFEEFTQLGDQARNRGSGLGLSIVAKTAALLGLQIRWHSRPGRGSMFAVELPVASQLAPNAASIVPHSARKLRIGLVEDNPVVLHALTLALSSCGHDVVASDSGSGLLEMLGETGPEIVISDHRLAKGKTGLDVIAAARSVFGAGLPAIILTGDTDQDLSQRMSQQGIAVLYKPVQIDAMELAISETTKGAQL